MKRGRKPLPDDVRRVPKTHRLTKQAHLWISQNREALESLALRLAPVMQACEDEKADEADALSRDLRFYL